MPAVHFLIEWPNGAKQSCYSPSRIVEEHFTAGMDYTVPDFLDRSRKALRAASERVRARYGMGCSAALDQLESLEEAARTLSSVDKEGRVKVVHLEKQMARDVGADASPHPSRGL